MGRGDIDRNRVDKGARPGYKEASRGYVAPSETVQSPSRAESSEPTLATPSVPDAIVRQHAEDPPPSYAVRIIDSSNHPTVDGATRYQWEIVEGNGLGTTDVKIDVVDWRMDRYGEGVNTRPFRKWQQVLENVPRHERDKRELFGEVTGAKLKNGIVYSLSTGCGRDATIIAAVHSGLATAEAPSPAVDRLLSPARDWDVDLTHADIEFRALQTKNTKTDSPAIGRLKQATMSDLPKRRAYWAQLQKEGLVA